jgi:hypothetical protein
MQKNSLRVSLNRQNAGHASVLVMLIAAVLIVQAILRGWVAIDLLLASGIEGELGGLVHWRVFDGFTGWVALMILAMTDEADGRGRGLTRGTLAVGVAAFAISLLLGEVHDRALVEIGVAVILAVAGALVAGRQVLALAKASRQGLNVEQLWRGIASQWILLWVAAEITLRVRFSKEGVESEETARSLLFLLPILGVTPNVLMAAGIRWWGGLREEAHTAKPRVRAWLVAMVFLNVGAVLVIGGSVWARGIGIAGAAFMIAGILLYLIGFPTRAWRAASGAWCVPLAFTGLGLGLLMMIGELVMQRSDVPTLYSAAWRHLLASIATLWLLGIGSLVLARRVPPRIAAGTRTLASISRWLLLLGVLFATGILLAAISDRDSLRGLFLGAALQLAAFVLATAIALRASKGLRSASPAR